MPCLQKEFSKNVYQLIRGLLIALVYGWPLIIFGMWWLALPNATTTDQALSNFVSSLLALIPTMGTLILWDVTAGMAIHKCLFEKGGKE